MILLAAAFAVVCAIAIAIIGLELTIWLRPPDAEDPVDAEAEAQANAWPLGNVHRLDDYRDIA